MKCNLCGGILGRRYVLRENIKLCPRHYVNDGLKSGDKLVLDNKVVYIAGNDKVENYKALRERG